MGNTPSGSANEGGRSRPPVPATPATPAAPAAWDGPPVYAEAVPMEATPAAPPLSPEALREPVESLGRREKDRRTRQIRPRGPFHTHDGTGDHVPSRGARDVGSASHLRVHAVVEVAETRRRPDIDVLSSALGRAM